MYPIAVVGDNPAARAMLLACQKSGLTKLTWVRTASGGSQPTADKLAPAYILSANLSRIIQALLGTEALNKASHAADREQVRFGKSAYLLSELPLGDFCNDRYGAPHVNIEADDLMQLLTPASVELEQAELLQLEQDHEVVIKTDSDDAKTDSGVGTATHKLWHATSPFDAALGKANITWLGKQQTIWQFTTPSKTHYLMAGPAHTPWQVSDWHPSLHQALSSRVPHHDFEITESHVREHWHAGHTVYVGDANYQNNPYRPECTALGLEDAWVLSRMLDNYEEDIGDGLREYVKYRRPRAAKVAKNLDMLAQQHNLHTPMKRALRHLNTAFATRFMPEIAMQRIDWLYNYDCIKGFR